jgi:CMP-N-acetylneuraminic acid synthetase
VHKYDSLLTVQKYTPFFWRKNNETQTTSPTYSLKNRPMRQELTEDDFYYHDNGNVYITKMHKYLENKIRVSGSVFLHETSNYESMQIDTQEDFDLMTLVYEKIGNFL